ncbi:MAG: polysaccharide biosynthesis protein [Eubacterium sp.]|jgi:Membrane protein involved in the export of O-antigen and teichoic acid|nr:polysaccharide biosynthesis protein [Eubacterium sp.]
MANRNKNRNKNQDFLMQGGVLAAAAILGRIIGLIYRIPLTNIIGDLGNNYYGCAFDIYNIFLLISSYSLPMAVSRLVADYRTKGESRNAYRLLKCAFLFAMFVGALACAAIFFGARYITATVFETPLSLYALRVLAPTLFITAFLGVLRGFFQGMENMYPSAVSQVLEQLVNAFVSVLAAYFFASKGGQIGRVLANEEGYHAAYGAAGASLGTTVGAAFSLLFLYILYKGFVRIWRKKMRKEHAKRVPYEVLFRKMFFTVLPFLAASALFNLNIVIEQGIFKHMMKGAAQAEQVALWWGVFSGKFRTMLNLPVAIAAAIGAACIPSITASFVKKRQEEVVLKTELAIRFSMLIAFPASFLLMLLSAPLMEFLFQDTQPLASGLLLAGGSIVIFYSLATVTASILQGVGKLRAPVIHSGISLVLQVIVLVVLLKFTDLHIYAVVASMAVFGICVTVLNQVALYRSGYWAPEFMKTFVLPGVCASIMASMCWIIEVALSQVVAFKYVTVPVAFVCGVMIYMVLLLTLRAMTPEEMRQFPGGRRMARMMKRF